MVLVFQGHEEVPPWLKGVVFVWVLVLRVYFLFDQMMPMAQLLFVIWIPKKAS
jgi:hypothetical protein